MIAPLMVMSDAMMLLSNIDEMMKEESMNLHEAIVILQQKHKECRDRVQYYVTSHEVDQSEIKRLKGL